VDSESKEEIERLAKELRESLTAEDADEIRAKTEALQSAFHRVSEAMYQRASERQQQAAPDGAADTDGQAGGATGDDDDVVDAEVVDESKS
jgi:molecular chaperone DnaK